MNDSRQLSTDPATPLVSVICRSINRVELLEALQSIASQSYSPVEVVLVDATGKGIAVDQTLVHQLNLKQVSTGNRLGRSQAANLGLQHCEGKYLVFLDDDDFFAGDHILNLVNFLGKTPRIRAAYASTRKVAHDGTPLDVFFDLDFDPVLLRKDNYIPLHAMVFAKSLLDEDCQFDESLDIYEDWDFWLQLSQHTPFVHVPAVTAFYRQGGDSDTAIDDDALRFDPNHPIAKARAAIYEKWRTRWSGAELNELVGSLDATADLAALQHQLDATHGQLLEEQRVNVEKQARIEALHAAGEYLRSKLASSTALIDELHNTLDEVSRDRWHIDQNRQQLQERLDAIYHSTSWRAMGPARRVRRVLDELLLFPLKRRIHFNRYGTELILSGEKARHTSPIGPANKPGAADVKASYRQRAEDNLAQFLNSERKLIFPATAEPRVTILLVLYNQAPLTFLCLESILQNATVSYELVIVDNASSDDTAAMLARLENVHLTSNADNLGFVKAVNQGAALSHGEYILLLNNDALLHEFSIEAALATFREVPDTGAVGGKILLLDGSLQEAGSFIFNDGSCLGYGRHQDPMAGEYMFQRAVDYCSGAFLMFRRDLFNEMGGFDEDYAPAYYEDSDFCVRLQERGLKVIYNPQSIITHYEFASSGGQDKASQLQTSHRQILCNKHAAYLATRRAPAPENWLAARSANEFINVLLIDDRVPHANFGSGYPRSKHIATLLAHNQVNLTFYPLQFPQESWVDTYNTLPTNVEVMLGKGVAGLANFLASRQGFYQVIMVSRIHNMQNFVEVVRANPALTRSARIIYDAEAVTAPRDIMYRELQGEMVDEAEKQRLISKEIALAGLADTVITVSAQEAALYQDQGYKNTVVLGHAMTIAPTPNRFETRQDLLFVGALRDENSPNVDSLIWFVKQVMPLLLKRIPELRLRVVGDNSAASMALIKSDAVEFLGRLDDITPLYNDCRVFIAPTRFAAGIPHKIHEAASLGIPCVTTTLLARQLGWHEEQELLVADSAVDFARQCERLYLQQDCWENTRSAALAAVTRDCSAEQFKSRLMGLFQ